MMEVWKNQVRDYMLWPTGPVPSGMPPTHQSSVPLLRFIQLSIFFFFQMKRAHIVWHLAASTGWHNARAPSEHSCFMQPVRPQSSARTYLRTSSQSFDLAFCITTTTLLRSYILPLGCSPLTLFYTLCVPQAGNLIIHHGHSRWPMLRLYEK